MRLPGCTDVKTLTVIIMEITKNKALDCTDASAKMVLSYYRQGILLWLPFSKYAPFLKWMISENDNATNPDMITCEKHTGKRDGKGILIQMIKK